MMSDEYPRGRLGRGLAALIGDADHEPPAGERPKGPRVPIEYLRPNPRNPRKSFNEKELNELAASIRQRGIVQPIVVRELSRSPETYEIVAGERRWRAAQQAGLHEVPIAIVEADDKTSLEFAIIENVQRSDLNAIEEAGGYAKLMNEFGYSPVDLATILGRSRSHVSNTLRLLNLAPSIQELVVAGRISAGHARALLAVAHPDVVAQQILDEGLTVRDVEQIAYADHGNAEPRPPARSRRSVEKDPDTRALEKALEDVLGLSVAIDHKGQGGELRIRYRSLDQLDGLCRGLRGSATA